MNIAIIDIADKNTTKLRLMLMAFLLFFLVFLLTCLSWVCSCSHWGTVTLTVLPST